ncbi:MAG: hypothetical protein WC010_02850 [Candidatus Absconditabacterales bacterium]
MNKKVLMPIAIVAMALTLSALAGCGRKNSEEMNEKNTNTTEITTTGTQATNAPAKEFTMTSFVEMVDEKPHPQYSIKEMTVKKGELVRIKVTVTKGMHDFNIDEFNVHSETPLDQETVIEFTADKAGTFIYYCSKPGHRANGHWGTLTVTE